MLKIFYKLIAVTLIFSVISCAQRNDYDQLLKLHRALWTYDFEAVSKLIRSGVKPDDLFAKDFYRDLAINNDRNRILLSNNELAFRMCLNLLILAGLNTDLRNPKLQITGSNGRYALINSTISAVCGSSSHYVVRNPKYSACIIDRLNTRSTNNTTPLMYAAARGQSKWVKWLLDTNNENLGILDIAAKDDNREDALDLARLFNRNDIINLFRINADRIAKKILKASKIKLAMPIVRIIAKYILGDSCEFTISSGKVKHSRCIVQ